MEIDELYRDHIADEVYKLIDVFLNVLDCLVYPVPTHVTFSYKNNINQVKVEAKIGGIFN